MSTLSPMTLTGYEIPNVSGSSIAVKPRIAMAPPGCSIDS